MTSRPKALLDTNILAPARLRDLFIRLDTERLIDVYASEEILVEMDRALAKGWPYLTAEQRAKAVEFVRMSLDGKLSPFPARLVEAFALPDPNDRHIAAAAYASNAVIVTHNLKDFPAEALEPWAMEAMTPDTFLYPIASSSPQKFIDVVKRQEEEFGVERHGRLIDELEKHDRLSRTMSFLRGLVP